MNCFSDSVERRSSTLTGIELQNASHFICISLCLYFFVLPSGTYLSERKYIQVVDTLFVLDIS